ncbi:LytR/AlgR family response regulator transcription factor [Terriglobus albidus]|nr:response regulator [Terriglobus albidus]
MQIRALLADDEPAARARLRRLLDRDSSIHIVGEAENGVEALQGIEQLRPDLLFLDVEMPGLNGFEVLKSISADKPRPFTIFITGFHEYAMEAFRERAIAYLLKPIEEEDLREMVERAAVLIQNASSRRAEDEKVNRLLGNAPPSMQQIVARKANRIFLMNPADAVYFFMDSGILRMRVENDTYWVNYQIGELEEALEGRGFFRAHRASLVNLARIKELRLDPGSSIVLVMNDAKNSEIEVSERQARALRARIPGL